MKEMANRTGRCNSVLRDHMDAAGVPWREIQLAARNKAREAKLEEKRVAIARGAKGVRIYGWEHEPVKGRTDKRSKHA
jgi:hypothetical protein